MTERVFDRQYDQLFREWLDLKTRQRGYLCQATHGSAALLGACRLPVYRWARVRSVTVDHDGRRPISRPPIR